jgi:outer membrane protein OmpA-like peptidoglycan-associated protein
MKSDLLFDTGKADLKKSAREDLRQIAEVLKKYPEDVVTVRGYTDNVGSDRVNDLLSEKRAAAVKKTLVAYGVPENTISTKGYGESNPTAENTTAEGRQKNRRVELDIKADESKVPEEKK